MKSLSFLPSKEVRELLRYSKRYIKYQKIIFIFSPILLTVGAISPFLVRYLFDNIILKSDFSKLPLFVLLFIAVRGIERVLSVVVNYNFRKCGNSITRDEQTSFIRKIFHLPVKDISGNNTGDMIARATSDIPLFSESVNTAIPGIVFNVIELIIFGGVLIYLSWQLALVVFVTIPFYNLSINTFNKRVKEFSNLEREKNSEVVEGIRERIEGAVTVKRFDKFDYFVNTLKNKVEDWAKTSNKYHLLMQVIEDFITFIRGICPIIVLSFGGYLVMKGSITLGTLIGFYSFMNWIYEPIRVLSHFLVSLQSAVPIFRRIREVHETEEEKGGEKILDGVNDIEYKNVCFSYNSIPVLREVNLKINPNERIAIVGTSGAGKSTLITLLPRYYDPEKGNVIINGEDVRSYVLNKLRKKVIVVHQNDFLFNMSIRENIILDDNFGEEEFRRAVKIACVDKFVDKLEKGYDTIVGERGSKLSDGQRQRVAIARAVIRKPKVLILDEATSGVDSQTEEEIFNNLKKLNMTIIIISHRLSTIRKADRVVVLDKGRVVEEGKHEELMKKGLVYKKILESQLTV